MSSVKAKVRIAVCVNSQGGWSAAGKRGAKDFEAIEEAREGMDDTDPSETIVFIEAEVPVPIIKTVPGTVIKH